MKPWKNSHVLFNCRVLHCCRNLYPGYNKKKNMYRHLLWIHLPLLLKNVQTHQLTTHGYRMAFDLLATQNHATVTIGDEKYSMDASYIVEGKTVVLMNVRDKHPTKMVPKKNYVSPGLSHSCPIQNNFRQQMVRGEKKKRKPSTAVLNVVCCSCFPRRVCVFTSVMCAHVSTVLTGDVVHHGILERWNNQIRNRLSRPSPLDNLRHHLRPGNYLRRHTRFLQQQKMPQGFDFEKSRKDFFFVSFIAVISCHD